MAYEIRRYRINGVRLNRAFRDGFRLTDEGMLVSTERTRVAAVFFAALDGVTEGCPWARLVFDADVGEDSIFNVKAIASDDERILFKGRPMKMNALLRDPGVSSAEKLALFENAPDARASIYSDMLLYGLNGRYLWVCLTARGEAARFSNFRAFTPGDRFLRTFPEVYREPGNFFHRYLSVFSSLYNDLEASIDHACDLLDPDTCPATLLPVYASWFGMASDGDYIDEDRLRVFLKKAYALIRMKGTRESIEELVGIFVDAPFHIVEHVDAADDQGTRRALQRLYGDDPYSFTLLIRQKPDEKLQLRLTRLIGQFKPLLMDVRILFLGDRFALDDGANLDVNAYIADPSAGSLDGEMAMDETHYLT
ncbi:MAG: hypothetical protein LBL63_07320 [Clostridiales Family XIII bacterium]|jgi:phage tail-like protein|nr:hypothetical protein [Clostridiales Family XIII bacterium]